MNTSRIGSVLRVIGLALLVLGIGRLGIDTVRSAHTSLATAPGGGNAVLLMGVKLGRAGLIMTIVGLALGYIGQVLRKRKAYG